MLKGSSKKFIIFVCIVLAMFATLGMTPETKRKQMLKPVTSLYYGKSDSTASEDTEQMVADSPKVIVKPDNAEKEVLNVEQDPDHPDQLLPVADTENKVVEDDEDSSVSDAKLEAILDEAPL